MTSMKPGISTWGKPPAAGRNSTMWSTRSGTEPTRCSIRSGKYSRICSDSCDRTYLGNQLFYSSSAAGNFSMRDSSAINAFIYRALQLTELFAPEAQAVGHGVAGTQDAGVPCGDHNPGWPASWVKVFPPRLDTHRPNHQRYKHWYRYRHRPLKSRIWHRDTKTGSSGGEKRV